MCCYCIYQSFCVVTLLRTWCLVVNLQGELATLERMLVELEVETATLNQKEREEPPVSPYAYELQHEQRSPYRHDDENEELYAHPEEEYSDDRAASEDEDNFESEGDEIEEQDPDTSRQQQQVQGFHESESPGNTSSVVEEDVKLSQVCYKSLSIGMHLAKKMDQVNFNDLSLIGWLDLTGPMV